MNYITTELEDVLLLRWVSVGPEDVDAVVAWIKKAHQREGGPVTYIAVAPTDATPPDAEGRRALMQGHHDIADLCTCLRLVIPGSGMRQAIIRSISAGIMLANGLRGKGFEIDDRFQTAAEAVAAVARPSMAQIVSCALESKIVKREELDPE